MSAVEDLLRETLRDERRTLAATPALRIAVQRRYRAARHRRIGLAVAAGLSAAAVLLGTTVVLRDRPEAVGPAGRIELPGTPSDAVLSDGTLWVTTLGRPGTLLALDPATGQVRRQRRLPGIADGGTRVEARIAVDPAAGLVWTMRDAGPDGDSVRTNVAAFDLASLASRGSWEIDDNMTRPVAVAGRLWTTSYRLQVIEPGSPSATEVPGTEEGSRVVLDPRSRRLLVIHNAPLAAFPGDAQEVVIVDPASRAVLDRRRPGFDFTQLTMSRDGRLWVWGESSATGSQTLTARRLAPETLSELPDVAKLQLSRGSSLQEQGGDQVVWVSDAGLTMCVDADTGTVLGSFDGAPYVLVSERGRAFGIYVTHGVTGIDRELRHVALPPGCPG